MQFKRSLDKLFPEEGYLSTAINECASILHQEREPEAEIEQEHLDEHLKQLCLNNINVPSSKCSDNTINFIFKIKQTRTLIKQAKSMFHDLQKTEELTKPFIKVVKALFVDWSELIKYHRKRTLTSMLHSDLIDHDMLENGEQLYKIIVNKNEQSIKQVKLTVKDTLVTV